MVPGLGRRPFREEALLERHGHEGGHPRRLGHRSGANHDHHRGDGESLPPRHLLLITTSGDRLEEGYSAKHESSHWNRRHKQGRRDRNRRSGSDQDEMERAVSDGGLAWFTDTKGRTVGVPAQSVAFVEIEAADGGPSVGFAPAV